MFLILFHVFGQFPFFVPFLSVFDFSFSQFFLLVIFSFSKHFLYFFTVAPTPSNSNSNSKSTSNVDFDFDFNFRFLTPAVASTFQFFQLYTTSTSTFISTTHSCKEVAGSSLVVRNLQGRVQPSLHRRAKAGWFHHVEPREACCAGSTDAGRVKDGRHLSCRLRRKYRASTVTGRGEDGRDSTVSFSAVTAVDNGSGTSEGRSCQ